MTLQKVSHQRITIKYINVIVFPMHTIECMSYPQALVYNSFQYYGVFAFYVLRSYLSCKRQFFHS